MKKIQFLSLLIFLISCEKKVDVINEYEVYSEVDTENFVAKTKASLQRTTITYDANHRDSALIQLPTNYRIGKHPLLLSFAGLGGRSAHGNLDVLDGVANKLRKGMPIPGNMIVVCPQNYTGYFSPYQINLMINYLVKTYAIDTTRIYLTGFSAGGFNVLNYLTDKPEYAKRVAAAVPMSTLNLDATHFMQLRYLAEQNTRVKIFCGTADGFFANNKKYAYYISTLKTGIAEFVPYNGGHNGWFRIFSSTNNYYKPNMYEWMLRFSKK